MVEQLQLINGKDVKPFNILELGPGTGPLTNEIVKLLRPADHLDVVEVQEKFFKIVNNKFPGKNISVHFNDFLEFTPEKRYKFIFSSLPYDIMPRPVIRKIWEKKLSLCAPTAYICYFKYLKFRKFKCDYEEQVVKHFKHDKQLVFRNLPPAHIYTLRIDETDFHFNTLANSA